MDRVSIDASDRSSIKLHPPSMLLEINNQFTRMGNRSRSDIVFQFMIILIIIACSQLLFIFSLHIILFSVYLLISSDELPAIPSEQSTQTQPTDLLTHTSLSASILSLSLTQGYSYISNQQTIVFDNGSSMCSFLVQASLMFKERLVLAATMVIGATKEIKVKSVIQ